MQGVDVALFCRIGNVLVDFGLSWAFHGDTASKMFDEKSLNTPGSFVLVFFLGREMLSSTLDSPISSSNAVKAALNTSIHLPLSAMDDLKRGSKAAPIIAGLSIFSLNFIAEFCIAVAQNLLASDRLIASNFIQAADEGLSSYYTPLHDLNVYKATW